MGKQSIKWEVSHIPRAEFTASDLLQQPRAGRRSGCQTCMRQCWWGVRGREAVSMGCQGNRPRMQDGNLASAEQRVQSPTTSKGTLGSQPAAPVLMTLDGWNNIMTTVDPQKGSGPAAFTLYLPATPDLALGISDNQPSVRAASGDRGSTGPGRSKREAVNSLFSEDLLYVGHYTPPLKGKGRKGTFREVKEFFQGCTASMSSRGLNFDLCAIGEKKGNIIECIEVEIFLMLSVLTVASEENGPWEGKSRRVSGAHVEI